MSVPTYARRQRRLSETADCRPQQSAIDACAASLAALSSDGTQLMQARGSSSEASGGPTEPRHDVHTAPECSQVCTAAVAAYHGRTSTGTAPYTL